LQTFEELARAAHLDTRETGQVLQTPTSFDHLKRRTTTTVAIAKGDQELLLEWTVLKTMPGAARDARQQRPVVGGAFAGPQRRRTQEMGQHIAPVGSAP